MVKGAYDKHQIFEKLDELKGSCPVLQTSWTGNPFIHLNLSSNIFLKVIYWWFLTRHIRISSTYQKTDYSGLDKLKARLPLIGICVFN